MTYLWWCTVIVLLSPVSINIKIKRCYFTSSYQCHQLSRGTVFIVRDKSYTIIWIETALGCNKGVCHLWFAPISFIKNDRTISIISEVLDSNDWRWSPSSRPKTLKIRSAAADDTCEENIACTIDWIKLVWSTTAWLWFSSNISTRAYCFVVPLMWVSFASFCEVDEERRWNYLDAISKAGWAQLFSFWQRPCTKLEVRYLQFFRQLQKI